MPNYIARPSSSPSQSFVLLYFLSFLLTSTSFPDILYSRCWGADYTSNSSFETNLQTLFQQIPRDASPTGFFSSSYGVDPGAAYGLALCRGDISESECKNCLHMIIMNITTSCPFGSNAALWFDKCFLRYSDTKILPTPDTTHLICLGEPAQDPQPDVLNQAVTQLMMYLSSAASNNARKFSVAKTNLSSYTTIYGLAQCARDLSQADCSHCLNTSVQILVSQNCAAGSASGWVLGESCNVHYDAKCFYNISASYIESSSPTTTRTTSSASSSASPPLARPAISPVSKGISNRIILAIAVSAAAGVAALLGFVCLYKIIAKVSKKGGINTTRGATEIQIATDDQDMEPTTRIFSFEVLTAATDNFSDSKQIGKGGFGRVYEAVIDGTSVAIKRVYKRIMERKLRMDERKLKKTLFVISKIDNANILKLLGYCVAEDHYLFVYELMPNGSLSRHLKDRASRENLNWATRFKIIKGIADGLHHLHHGCGKNILHVDLKPANILLSEDLTAKIADFDLLRTLETDETHQSTAGNYGTPGYMAPEVKLHAPRKRYSLKSDVYSFGIIILELVTGERIGTFGNEDSSQNLMSFVWYHWKRKKEQKVIDPYLDVQIPNVIEQINRCVQIGLLCIQQTAAKRPDILQVLSMLNNSEPLPAPLAPGFLTKESTQTNELGCLKSIFGCTE